MNTKDCIKQLRKALRACATCIEEEVNQSGDEDHPTLNGHRKVAQQARALLAKTEQYEEGVEK